MFRLHWSQKKCVNNEYVSTCHEIRIPDPRIPGVTSNTIYIYKVCLSVSQLVSLISLLEDWSSYQQEFVCMYSRISVKQGEILLYDYWWIIFFFQISFSCYNPLPGARIILYQRIVIHAWFLFRKENWFLTVYVSHITSSTSLNCMICVYLFIGPFNDVGRANSGNIQCIYKYIFIDKLYENSYFFRFSVIELHVSQFTNVTLNGIVMSHICHSY